MTLLLVRHAIALARHKWEGDDEQRPLTGRGERQADGLVELLAPFPATRVLTSRAVRCVGTITPLAKARALRVELVDELFEGRGVAALPLLEDDDDVVVCSHGDVLPELLLAIASRLAEVPDDPPFAKGATWVIERKDGRPVSARYLAPPA